MSRSNDFSSRWFVGRWRWLAAGLVAAMSHHLVGENLVGQEKVFSGPQPGEKVKSFKVLRIEADETKELAIVRGRKKSRNKKSDSKKSGQGTTLICFVHRLSNDDRILFGLGLVDFYVSRYKDLTSHFVVLSDDRVKITKMLRAWSRGAVFSKSLVSLSLDGAEGPGFYGLNRKVAMTVLVVRDDKVVENLVFHAPNAYDLQKIMVAVAKTIGAPEPKLAKVQAELRAERQRQFVAKIKTSPVFKLAPNDQLGRMMYIMVHPRGNRSLVAKRMSKQMSDWAGDNGEKRATLQKYCRAVLAGNFEVNRYASEALRMLAPK